MVMDVVGEIASLFKTEKAKLICVTDPAAGLDKEVECMFNPTDYSISQGVAVKTLPNTGKPGGTPQYTGTNPMSITVKLFDDFASLEGDVTPSIATMMGWMRPNMSATPPAPPKVSFRWGKNPQLANFSVSSTRSTSSTLFRKDGTPVGPT